jgi:hypothetical protein
MATFNGTAIPLGQIQSSYSDQMATALAGQLYSESDINLTDSVLVDEADGITCGLGVISAVNASATRPGVNDTSISLPAGTEAATDFAGVVIRPFTAFSSGDNAAYIKDNWGAMLLSGSRVGGRVWVTAYLGATNGAAPYWRIKADVGTDTTTPVGGFCGSAITGVTPAVAATGSVTNSAVPADASTLQIGSVTYRFKSTMAAAQDIKLEATLDATMAHLVKVINGTSTEGVDCYAGTTTQAATLLAAYNSPVLSLTAVTAGTSGNSIALVETGSTMIVSAATLTGGAAATTTTDTVQLTGYAKWGNTASAGGLAKLVIG